jgi:hypothetical protein
VDATAEWLCCNISIGRTMIFKEQDILDMLDMAFLDIEIICYTLHAILRGS